MIVRLYAKASRLDWFDFFGNVLYPTHNESFAVQTKSETIEKGRGKNYSSSLR